VLFSDKAKPSVRVGRKATGLSNQKMAQLPKNELLANLPFLLVEGKDVNIEIDNFL